jgi:hypothetical protein
MRKKNSVVKKRQAYGGMPAPPINAPLGTEMQHMFTANGRIYGMRGPYLYVLNKGVFLPAPTPIPGSKAALFCDTNIMDTKVRNIPANQERLSLADTMSIDKPRAIGRNVKSTGFLSSLAESIHFPF